MIYQYAILLRCRFCGEETVDIIDSDINRSNTSPLFFANSIARDKAINHSVRTGFVGNRPWWRRLLQRREAPQTHTLSIYYRPAPHACDVEENRRCREHGDSPGFYGYNEVIATRPFYVGSQRQAVKNQFDEDFQKLFDSREDTKE